MTTRKTKTKSAPVRELTAVERELALVTPDFYGTEVGNMRRSIPYKISGKPFECRGFQLVAARCLALRSPDTNRWRVLEVTSGSSISISDTRKGALEDALKILGSRTELEMQRARDLIETVIKRAARAA